MLNLLIFIINVIISLILGFLFYQAILEETNLSCLLEEDEVNNYITRAFIFILCYLFIQISVYSVYLFGASIVSLLKIK